MTAKGWIALSLLVLVAGGAGGPSAPPRADVPPAAVRSVKDGVEVAVTFLNAEEPQPEGQLAFSITFDNHAIDLGKLKLDSRAILKPDPGEPVSTGFGWKQEGSGHHASGLLTLKNQNAAGKPIVSRQTRSLTLELRDAIGSGSLVFQFENGGWNVPQNS